MSIATRRRKHDERDGILRAVDEFNRLYPVGAAVILETDSGPVQTTVTGPARELGRAAVAQFAGVRGVYACDKWRLRRADEL